ncbi:MAG TPA: calcineurin [Ruminococcaceae bacterium]|nr:calcineurin [Oscillospiraceae bacterium]
MTYVISDLHGYPLEKSKKLLEKAKFSDNDFLYILGDVIDRNGDGGVEMLCWLLEQPNIQLILGNHEAMLLSCEFVFDEITNESVEAMNTEKVELLSNYMFNGGDLTLAYLRELNKTSPETVSDILDYLHDAPLYEAITVGGNDFLLVHSGIDNFDKNKKLSSYSSDDLLWARPKLDDEYFDDIITVFGHTPTRSYGEGYTGKIIKTKTWINIDVGAGFGQEPVLLRLDDFKEFQL